MLLGNVQENDLYVFADPSLSDIIPGEKIEVPSVKDNIEQLENRILEAVKGIEGELLLPGLVDRIDSCLSKVDKARGESGKKGKKRNKKNEKGSE